MKKRLKKIIGVIMAATMLTGVLAGCASDPAGETGSSSGSSQESGEGGGGDDAKGRFLESEIILPEEIKQVQGFTKLEDGSLRLAAMGANETNSFWKSTDKGETWEKESDFPDEIKNQYIGTIAMAPTGDSAAIVYAENVELYSISKDGALTKLDVALDPLEMPGASEDKESQSDFVGSEQGTGEQSETAGMETGEFSTTGSAPESEAAEDETPPAETGETQLPEGEGEGAAQVSEGEDGIKMNEENNVENTIHDIRMTDDGKILGVDYIGKIYKINPQDGSIEHEFDSGGYVNSFDFAGNTLYLIDMDNNLQMFDLESGEPLTTDQVLSEELTKEANDMAASYGMGSRAFLFKSGDQENSLYYCNSSGLYRHLVDGSVSERMIDGGLVTFGGPQYSFTGMEVLSEEEILVGVTSSQPTGGSASQLLRYTYSKDAPARPSKEVKVYSLNENMEVRQAIAMFQKANPDYYVNFEVGMTGEDGITAADALRTLNTDIMAGKGPDIMLLDGMPVESYIERGLLADASDIIEKVKAGDGLFENIIDAYAKDGAYYALPARVQIPMIQGSDEAIKAAGSLEELAALLEAQNKELIAEKGKLSIDSPTVLANKIYQTYSTQLQQEDGTIDKARLIDFYTQLKRMYGDPADHEQDEAEGYSVGMQANDSNIEYSALNIAMGTKKTNLGNLTGMQGIMTLNSIRDKMAGAAQYGQLTAGGEKVFVPGSLVGINSKTEKMEDAKAFMEYLFGQEAQMISQSGGFPVNKKAFEAQTVNNSSDDVVGGMMVSGDDGVNLSLDMLWPKEEDFKKIEDIISGMEKPMLTDDVIRTTVINQATECLNGNISPEQAADAVLQKVNLYLSE